jgi:nucleoside-diphosphate-sugar epimerase
LARLASVVAGRRLPIRSDPSRRRPAGTDINELVADRRRAAAMLGWTPAVSLEDGLNRTLKWMMECS